MARRRDVQRRSGLAHRRRPPCRGGVPLPPTALLLQGDGFSVLPADGTAEEFRISNGYELLAHDGPFPQLALKSEHGSVALGSRLTYMLPVRDDLVREGLFEIDAHGPRAAERAVAAHHGVPLGHVAITSRP